MPRSVNFVLAVLIGWPLCGCIKEDTVTRMRVTRCTWGWLRIGRVQSRLCHPSTVGSAAHKRRAQSDFINLGYRRAVAFACAKLGCRSLCRAVVLSERSSRTSLALVTEPCRGESFASWIERFSVDLEVPAATLTKRLRLGATDNTSAAFATYGVTLSDAAAYNICDSTGLGDAVVRGMLLTVYNQRVLRLDDVVAGDVRTVRTASKREWAQFRSSRACPDCLADKPVWQLWWKLGVAAVCPEHNVMLTDCCHECLMPHRIRYASDMLEVISNKDLPKLASCRAITPAGNCRADITNACAVAAPVEALEVQRTVLSVIKRGPHATAGEVLSVQQWFDAVRALCVAVRFSITDASPHLNGFDDATRESISAYCTRRDTTRHNAHGVNPVQYRQRPETSGVAAVLMRAVVPILTAGSTEDLADRLAVLHDGVQQTRRHLGRDVIRPDLGFPEPLRDVWMRLEAGVRRFSAVSKTTKSTSQAPFVSQVPQLAPKAVYDSVVAPLLPGTASSSGRLFTSLAVCRHRGDSSWAKAARTLSIEERKGIHTADALSRRVCDPYGFWQAVAQVSDHLESAPHVDLRTRRIQLANFTVIPAERFTDVATRHGFSATASKSRSAAAWLWAELTCSDWRDSPAIRNWPGGVTNESRREMYRKAMKALPDGALDDLRAVGLELLGES